MIQHSEEAIFLCDHTKFDRLGYTATAQLKDLTYLITDTFMPDGWDEEIEKQGVIIKYAKQ